MFGFKKRRMYLDHASAPPVLPECARAIHEAERLYGNPGAIHAEGVAAKKSLDDSRACIAELMGCKAREVFFTSGLSESNNLAILGYAQQLQRTKRTLQNTHWIVSAIEHDSVLSCFGEIESMGGDVAYVEPDDRGLILPQIVEKALRPETVFVSVGWANNEIGVVQPVAKIARVLREQEERHGSRIVFHADAGQGPLYLSTLVHGLGVDLLALGANKLYGPHGIGALYIEKNLPLAPVLLGGKQERGLRAGTESVALAAGFAKAFEIIAGEREEEAKRLRVLRDELAKKLTANIPGLIVNGSTPFDKAQDKSLTAGWGLRHLLPHMLNVSVPNIQSEYVTLALDHAGIAISTKSACREGEGSRSHVVSALGGASWRAENTLRFSLGRGTVGKDIKRMIDTLVPIMEGVSQ